MGGGFSAIDIKFFFKKRVDSRVKGKRVSWRLGNSKLAVKVKTPGAI
jgi:hypothetical protein